MDPYRKFRVLVSPLLSALGCTALVLYLGEGQLPVSLGFSATVAASYAAALIYLQRRLRALEPDLSHAG